MKSNLTAAEIATQLNKAKVVAIFCHVRPDGDALGSALSLKNALENAGKTAYAICEDAPPQKYLFIEGVNEMLTEIPQGVNFDTFVTVDSADKSRLGKFEIDYLRFKGNKINIDHHISNDRYGDYNFVYECPATCQLLPEIFSAAKLEINEKIANLLAFGLITDSGNFTHQDVDEKTFTVAAKLKAKGANVNRLNYYLFQNQSKTRALLYGRVMNKMRFALEDKLVFITTTLADRNELGATSAMTEGFVDFPLTIDGIEVCASILQMNANQYKVSLRSKGKVNVNAVASQFGGGGHILASGCTLFGEYEEVIERITYAVYQNL